MTLCESIEKTAFEHGNKIAYINDTETLTYKELWAKAASLSKDILKCGTAPVLILGGKSASVLIAITACLISKRAYVPLEHGMPPERLKNIISQTGAKLVLRCETGKEAAVEHISDCENEEEKLGAQNETAYIIFTSGTTGRPKGVPISYENLENFSRWVRNIEGLENLSDARIYSQSSFSFDLSIAALCLAFGGGNTLVCSEKEPSQIGSVIREKNAEALVMTPTMLRLLMLEHGFSEANYPVLKAVYLCGEPLEMGTAERFLCRFPKAALINAYGPTEATSAVSAVKIEMSMLKEKTLPVGRISAAATEIFVRGGEIILKGKSVAKGYSEGSCGAFFTEDGENCYRTGDSGTIAGDFLYCSGRIDRQIKYKGYRIEPEEIESVLMSMEGVNAAAVLPKKKGETVLYLKAFVAADKGVSESVLRGKLKSFLPEYMIPKNIVFVEKMPLNHRGKTDMKRLEEHL